MPEKGKAGVSMARPHWGNLTTPNVATASPGSGLRKRRAGRPSDGEPVVAPCRLTGSADSVGSQRRLRRPFPAEAVTRTRRPMERNRLGPVLTISRARRTGIAGDADTDLCGRGIALALQSRRIVRGGSDQEAGRSENQAGLRGSSRPWRRGFGRREGIRRVECRGRRQLGHSAAQGPPDIPLD